MRWWELGSSKSRQVGPNFNPRDLTCPYCGQKGDYTIQFSKTRPGGGMTAEVHQCSCCANLTFVLWKRAALSQTGIDFLSEPSPKPSMESLTGPEDWPELVADSWIESHKAVLTKSWRSAVVMARTAIQAAVRDQGGQGRTIYDEIEDLRKRGLLPQSLVEWAHELRTLGAEGTHVKEDQKPITEEDARQAKDLAFYFGHYLFTVPKDVQKMRERRKKPGT